MQKYCWHFFLQTYAFRLFFPVLFLFKIWQLLVPFFLFRATSGILRSYAFRLLFPALFLLLIWQLLDLSLSFTTDFWMTFFIQFLLQPLLFIWNDYFLFIRSLLSKLRIIFNINTLSFSLLFWLTSFLTFFLDSFLFLFYFSSATTFDGFEDIKNQVYTVMKKLCDPANDVHPNHWEVDLVYQLRLTVPLEQVKRYDESHSYQRSGQKQTYLYFRLNIPRPKGIYFGQTVSCLYAPQNNCLNPDRVKQKGVNTPKNERIDRSLKGLYQNSLSVGFLGVLHEVLRQLSVVVEEHKEPSHWEHDNEEEEVNQEHVRNFVGKVETEETFALAEEVEGELLDVALRRSSAWKCRRKSTFGSTWKFCCWRAGKRRKAAAATPET